MAETVLIVGGGPAGAASAMNLLSLGLQPLIIESDNFPRFHIGESLTTECVDALNRLGLHDELEALGAPQKNGVRIFSANPENSFYVGAGDAWQVKRSRFDKMMLDTAIKRGAQLIQGRVIKLRRNLDEWSLTIKNSDNVERILQARFVIDASGQKRFSHRQGIFGPLLEGQYAHQIAMFSHYKGIQRQPQDKYDTLIFHRETHEWCWMIPLSEEITSVGLVSPVESYKAQKKPAAEYLDEKLDEFSEPFTLRFRQAQKTIPVRTLSNYSFQVAEYARDGLYCVGDSHRFIDPIFSFGVEFAVLEAEYVGQAIDACMNAPSTEWPTHEQRYMHITSAAQNTISDMLEYFWAHPWGFANMAHVRHKDEFLELFAGRIYETEAGEGLRKMRGALV